MKIIVLILFLFVLGCGKSMTKSTTEIVVPEPEFKVQTLKTDISDFTPLAWETARNWGKTKAPIQDAKEWSKMIYSIIENEEPTLLETNSADDVENFCPRYRTLSNSQRLNFWGQFFVGVAKRESGWKPTSQMVETKFKYRDSVTQQPVKSEGFLQLSYQDEKSHRLDCGFNWGIDQYLGENDARRSILHPFLNLRCGIKIFALQLKKRHLIQVKNKYYWHVLKIGGASATEIQGMTKSLDICH